MPFFLLKALQKRFLKTPIKHNGLAAMLVFLSLSVASHSVWADIQPRGASQNFSQKSLSNSGNPAAAALIIARKDPHVMIGGSFEIGGGIEYGDLDELFHKIDELALLFTPPNEGDDGSQAPPTTENPDGNFQWEDLFVKYPELEDRLEIIKSKVVTTTGLLALIAAEGYGKAEAASEASFVVNEDFFGGTLLFGMTYKGNSKALGIFEDITFDSDYAKAQLKKITDLDENDPLQVIDISDGITLFYNPANKKVKMSVENDSLLLVKATKIAQLSLSYSRNVLQSDAGDLYLGVKPTFYRVGLTHVSTRVGEITDTEELFDDIKNADFIYQNGFDVDLGLFWAADHYQLGASVNSLFEHTYEFPDFDRGSFTSLKILSQLNDQSSYTMERQLKLEAGIFTDQRNWSLHVELDANAVEDPMRDNYQWLTMTGGYAADSWWLPSARLGFSRNLAGTKLAYVNAGVTVMKFINIDVATTIDTIRLDGNDMLRGASIRLGVQFDY